MIFIKVLAVNLLMREVDENKKQWCENIVVGIPMAIREGTILHVRNVLDEGIQQMNNKQSTWNMTAIINGCHLTILVQRKELMNKFKYPMMMMLFAYRILSYGMFIKYHKVLELLPLGLSHYKVMALD